MIRGRAPLVAALCLVVSTLVAFVAPPPTAEAAATVPFAPRKTFNDNGAIALIGNNLLTCPASSACSDARKGIGSGAALNNNNYAMVNLDADGSAFPTFNSSSSTLALPAGSTVLWAGLYWGARYKGATTAGDSTAPRNQMKLRGPTASAYQTITSSVEFGPNGTDQAYQEFADVTTIVQSQGNGAWWGADVAAGTGLDRYAGWSLYVIYRNPSLPLRNLTVFDGFNVVNSGNPQTITISGFLAPLTGTVQTQLGMVAYEGDLGSTGDAAFLNGSRLATASSPGTNFFDSANDKNGTIVTTRTPADVNMLGFDVMDFGAPGLIPNGATSAKIDLTTGGETYYPGAVSTTIDLYSPDFTSSVKTVTNLDGHDPAAPGDTLEYTVNFINTGGDPASQSVATDPLPPGTTFVPGSLQIVSGPGAGPKTDAADGDQAEFVAASRSVRFRLGTGANATTGGVISPGASTAISFRVTADTAAAGTTLTNQASLAYRAQTLNLPFTYVTNATDTPVVANANLSITKSTAPDPVSAGSQATSTIAVRNAGPNAAANVVVTDALSDDATFVSATASQGTCAQASGTVTCNLGSIANGGTVTIAVVVRVSPSSTATSLTDTASVSSDTVDPDQSDNTAGSTVGVVAAANLIVTKTAPPGTLTPGQQVVFTIDIVNEGPSDAAGAQVSEEVGDGLTLVSIDDPFGACGTPTICSLGTIAPGQTRTVHVTARLDDTFTGTSVTNTAAAVSQVPDPDPAAAVATITVPVGPPQANLAVAKAGDPTSVVAGGRVTYTVTTTNSGPSAAAGVIVTDTLPTGLTAVSASSSRGPCVIGPPVSCDIGDLGVGAVSVVTIIAEVSPSTAPGPATDSATAASATADPDPTNNTATAATTVTGEADLSVIKTATPTVAGQNIVYTVTAANAGPSDASGVTITDTPPAEFVFVSATSSQGSCGAPVGGSLACNLGAVASGDTATVTITMRVPTGFTGVATNEAAGASTTPDPDTSNNTGTFAGSTGAQADVAIDKTGPDTVVAGAPIIYTLTVSNAGPSNAAGVAVTDSLPPGLTATSANPSQGSCTTGPPVACTLGTVAPGAPVTITVTANVDPATANGDVLTNTADVTSTTNDPTASNNSATATTTVNTLTDLNVTKALVTPTTPPLAPGQPLDFAITVHNAGPSVAQSVTVVDQVDLSVISPDVTGDITAADCTFSSSDIACDLGSVDPGATKTFHLLFSTDPATALGAYTNTIRAASTTADTDLTDNTASAPFSLAATRADLAITKQGDSEYQAGGPFTYNITVTNNGPSDGQDVVVADTLPAELLPASAQASRGSCTIAGQNVTCDIGTLPVSAGGSLEEIIIQGTVDAAAPAGVVTNTATVTSSTADPDPSQNSASATATVVRQADLLIDKLADSDPLIAGTTVGYTVAVTNAGPSVADGVVVTDALPPALALDNSGSDPACLAGPPVTCDLGSVAPNETRLIRVVGRLDPSFTGTTIANTASVTSTTVDPNPGDESATLTSNVTQQADLAVTKLPDATTPSAGSQLTYTITVANNGPSDAHGVTLTDTVPAGTTLVSVTAVPPGSASCTPGATVSCSIPILVSGDAVTANVIVQLPPTLPAGTFTNTATASSATPDPDPSNDSATATVNTVVKADLKIVKTLVTNPIVAGAPVTYRMDVTNAGPAVAPNALISDTLPLGTTFTSASPGCVAVTGEGGIVVGCELGTLAVGGTASATITLTPGPGLAGTLANTAAVGAQAIDPNNADNESTAVGDIAARTDLAIAKTGPVTINAGGTATYRLSFANHGPSTATGVIVTDTLPTGLTPKPRPGCTVTGSTVRCAVGTLAPGAAGAIDIAATVSSAAAAHARLLDTATVAGNETDPSATNNTASAASTVVRATDIAVTVVASPTSVLPGKPATFVVTVKNNGPLAATGVTLVNTLPVILQAPGAAGASCTFKGNVATCSLADLPVGATTTLRFTGTVPTGTVMATRLVNAASVTIAETDTVAANNSASASATVQVEIVPLPPPHPGLPATGGDLGALLRGAYQLICAGLLLLLARRRSDHPANGTLRPERARRLQSLGR